MGNRLMATAQADHFSNHSSHTTRHIYTQGAEIIADYQEWTTNVVDYSNSTSAVGIDLTASVQHGGFAEGDVLTDIGEIQVRGLTMSSAAPTSTPHRQVTTACSPIPGTIT